MYQNALTDYQHTIQVDWYPDNHTTIWWNETCAMVLEVFGLPGDRYIYKPHVDYMEFHFKTPQDAFLCQILLSDRL